MGLKIRVKLVVFLGSQHPGTPSGALELETRIAQAKREFGLKDGSEEVVIVGRVGEPLPWLSGSFTGMKLVRPENIHARDGDIWNVVLDGGDARQLVRVARQLERAWGRGSLIAAVWYCEFGSRRRAM